MSRVPGKPRGGLAQPRWLKGVWLGKRWNSDEHIVSIPGGRVVRARAARPHPDCFDRAEFDAIRGIPCDPSGLWDGAGERPKGSERDLPRVPQGKVPIPVVEPRVRDFMIRREYLDRFDFTDGCQANSVCSDIIASKQLASYT